MQRTGILRSGLVNISWKTWLVALCALLCLGCAGNAPRASAQEGFDNPSDEVSYLDQYGTWIDVEPYGQVWQPSVNPGWRPFVHGHWVYTDDGWAWVSYEPYGWLVYHYGNWDYQPEVGWFWIVGDEWSPARVEWLTYDDYCSWAPLPPVGVVWQDPWHTEGSRIWVVVRGRDLDRDDIGHRRFSRPPLPHDKDRKDVIHGPLEVHNFEKLSGRTIKPEPLKHDPAPVYMHSKPAANPHDQQPHQQPQPPEQRPTESKPAQFHKMVLPPNEQARVNKYSPQVQKKVMVPKRQNNQPQNKGNPPPPPPPRKAAQPEKKK